MLEITLLSIAFLTFFLDVKIYGKKGYKEEGSLLLSTIAITAAVMALGIIGYKYFAG